MNNETKRGKIPAAFIVLIGMICILGMVRGAMTNGLGQFLWPASIDLGVSMGSISIYYVCCSLCSLIVLPIMGKLIQKYNIKVMMLGAAVFYCGGIMCFAIVQNVFQLYALSATNAIGSSILSTLIGPILINAWFKKKTGLAMGVMMASSFAIGAIVQPILGKSIAANGWKPTIVGLCLATFVIVCVAVIALIKPVPSKLGLKAYGEEDGGADLSGEPAAAEGISVGIARKSVAFFAMFVTMFLLTSAASFGPHVAPYVRSFGHDAVFAGQVNSGWLIGLCIGALSFGWISDKFGARVSVTLAVIAGVVGSLMLGFLYESKMMITIGVAVFAFFGASVSTIGPVLMKEIFGEKDFVPLFAGVSMGMTLGGLVAIGGFGVLFDLLGSYIPIMFALVALCLLTIVCVTIAYNSKKKMVAAGHWNSTRDAAPEKPET